ncbi:MAG: MMPL family transporter [Moraxellaceae bacterium]|nr:MMPL family transporter [Moraxellaceae bacterium]
MKLRDFVDTMANFLFGNRKSLLTLFALITVALGWSATQLRVDAGFEKMIPLQHPYMQTFLEYRKDFGGANRVVIALRAEKAEDIYSPEFFKALKEVTDDVFFLPGVDRASVMSLFTPNVRFIEVVEEGFSGGNVIPAEFAYTEEDLEQVRINVLKSGYVGRLVANDFKGAIVAAELLEIDPQTGDRLDYRDMAKKLEQIRTDRATDDVTLHIIGFAKAVGDIAEGAASVLVFFVIAFVITTILLLFYSGSLKLTVLALACAMVPVVWLLGILPIIGYGIDPMSILVPFLTFSIGVSHAVQMTNAWKLEVVQGFDSEQSARNAFSALFVPGAMALLSNAVGFLVMIYIAIDIVRELAITTSIGVAVMLVTNKMLLTILLTYVRLTPKELDSLKAQGGSERGEWLWSRLRVFARPKVAVVTLLVTATLLGAGTLKSRDLKTGDLGTGVPELHDDSRYNQDVETIVSSFSIGVDVLSVIVQSKDIDGACTDYEVMDAIDRFETHMRGVHGVASTTSLAGLSKIVGAGWNEGNPNWRVHSRNRDNLAQAVTPIDTSTGLLNTDCSVMQVVIYTKDHQGESIKHIVKEIKDYIAANKAENIDFLLASGNVGVMAATNEAVDEAEVIMLLMLFGAISLLVYMEFRSVMAVLCIVVPLSIAAVLCNALMATMGIGLKVATLPVIALGVGVGVDYGLYLFERMKLRLEAGDTLEEAFHIALQQRGTAAIFTAVTMSVSVGTWAFSALKFQADMGILLAFLFSVNMIGAVMVLPAMAAFMIKIKKVK